ncbi:MAG: TolC family protein, partial [Salinimicrobium sediminis]|nr:TolC family protein [Salinimicrobium sediminis]
SLALRNYPLLKNEKSQIDQEQALKKSAWDFGETEVFTGGEELGDAGGIYTTIGVQQKGIDLLGIPSKTKLYNKRIALAEEAYELSQLQVAQEVKIAWSRTFSAKQQYLLFQELDSLYQKLEQAVNLRYDVEAISRLEMLTAKNKVSQISVDLQQAEMDYLTALQKLNLWLGDEEVFDVPDDFQGILDDEIFLYGDLPEDHPLLEVSEKKVAVAEAAYAAEKANFLPDFSVQYGLQKVNGATGFYNYQAGISIPILSGAAHGEVKTAKIEKEIAQRAAGFKKDQIKSDFEIALRNYKRWKSSWLFYRDEVLPLLKEQREGSLLAFNEGAIEYVAFIQNLDNAMESEIKALKAFENYQIALAELQFYLTGKN